MGVRITFGILYLYISSYRYIYIYIYIYIYMYIYIRDQWNRNKQIDCTPFSSANPQGVQVERFSSSISIIMSTCVKERAIATATEIYWWGMVLEPSSANTILLFMMSCLRSGQAFWSPALIASCTARNVASVRWASVYIYIFIYLHICPPRYECVLYRREIYPNIVNWNKLENELKVDSVNWKSV